MVVFLAVSCRDRLRKLNTTTVEKKSTANNVVHCVFVHTHGTCECVQAARTLRACACTNIAACSPRTTTTTYHIIFLGIKYEALRQQLRTDVYTSTPLQSSYTLAAPLDSSAELLQPVCVEQKHPSLHAHHIL